MLKRTPIKRTSKHMKRSGFKTTQKTPLKRTGFKKSISDTNFVEKPRTAQFLKPGAILRIKKKSQKTKTATYWRKKGCELAKRIRRTETPYCEICGKSNCKIEGHHLLTVGAYPQMSNYLRNIIVLCVHCHKFGKISFHGSGTDIMKEKLEKKFPGRMDLLRMTASTRKRVDYKKEYEELLEFINT